jgi:hypothetical protein
MPQFSLCIAAANLAVVGLLEIELFVLLGAHTFQVLEEHDEVN